MADEELDSVKKGGGGSKIGIILVGVNLLVVGAGAAFVLTQQNKPAATAEAAKPKPKVKKFGPLIKVDPIIANLTEPDEGRYLKVALDLEIKDPDLQPDVELSMVPIRNALLLHFTSLNASDTEGAEKKVEMQTELKKMLNKLLGSKVIQHVYFTELVVQ